MANNPSLKQEAVNHGDAETPWKKQSLEHATKATVSSSLTRGSASFCTNFRNDHPSAVWQFHLDARFFTAPRSHGHSSDFPSRHTRWSTSSDVVVQNQIALTSAPAVARFRQWFRCPPLFNGLALNPRDLSRQLLSRQRKDAPSCHLVYTAADLWQPTVRDLWTPQSATWAATSRQPCRPSHGDVVGHHPATDESGTHDSPEHCHEKIPATSPIC